MRAGGLRRNSRCRWGVGTFPRGTANLGASLSFCVGWLVSVLGFAFTLRYDLDGS